MCTVVEHRECRDCEDVLPESSYRNKNQRVCKPCTEKRKKKRRRDNKKALVALRGGKCELCGYDKCIYWIIWLLEWEKKHKKNKENWTIPSRNAALDFHHIDPNTKFKAVAHLSYNLKLMIEEAKKCVMVCSNCHREIHAGIIEL